MKRYAVYWRTGPWAGNFAGMVSAESPEDAEKKGRGDFGIPEDAPVTTVLIEESENGKDTS